jgi:hypothetical protein
MRFLPSHTPCLAAALVLGSMPLLAVGQGCPNPASFCIAAHGPAATVSGGCAYADCFDMSYSEVSRAIAVGGDETLFPTRFHLWTSGPFIPSSVGFACGVQPSGNKLKIEILPPDTKCAGRVPMGDYVFYEHFASNPASGCLAWLECKAPTP